MSGGLCLKDGVLYVGRNPGAATIEMFDLDGNPLGTGFALEPADGARPFVRGLSVDADHRIWVADSGTRRVRAYTVTGQELSAEPGSSRSSADSPGSFGAVVDVDAVGVEDSAALWIACGGERRHGLQAVQLKSGRTVSLRSQGDVDGVFRSLVRVAVRATRVYAVEYAARRIQVFRDGAFLYSLRPFSTSTSRGFAFEPTSVAPLDDGRAVIAQAGPASAVWLVDAEGRILCTLASHGSDAGRVLDPSDVVVEDGREDRTARVAVMDRDGDRLQVFTLAGECYGAFSDGSPPIV